MTYKNSISAGAFALATLAVGLLPAQAAELGKTYEEILEGARQENTLEAWVIIPTKPETHRAVIDAFVKEFDLETKVNWVSITPATAVARTIAESKSGRVSVDILEGSEEEVAVAIKEDLAMKIDWGGLFSERFPVISELEQGVIEEFKGYALPYFDYPYGIGWNPDLIDESEVPAKWTDLTDPKWEGRFGFNQFALNPIAILGPFMGAEESIQYAKDIMANRPVLIRGTPAIAQSIVSGAVPIGVTGYTVAEAAIRRGEPIRFKLFEDYVPTAIQHLMVPNGAPSPNTAALFTAWFVSEGYKVADEVEPTPPPHDLTTDLSKMLAATLGAGATHARLSEIEHLEVTKQVLDATTLMLAGQN